MAPPPVRQPVIPAWLLHPTDQRLLFLSLFVLLQASKLAAFLLPAVGSAAPSSIVRWATADAAFILGVGALRVPRLSWASQVRAAAVALLVGADWLLLAGGWRSIPFSALLPSTLTSALTFYPTLSSSHARLSDILKPKQHLSGAFELVITPFSTARLLPPATTLPCLSDRTKAVPLPLHFSTLPGTIEYSLTLPAEQGGAVVLLNVSASALEIVKPRRSADEAVEGDEEDDEDEDENEVEALLSVRSSIAARKALTTGDGEAGKGVTLLLPVSQPGTVRLSRVFPPTGAGAHHSFRIPLSANEGVRVHRCPSVSLIPQLPSGTAGESWEVAHSKAPAKGVVVDGGEKCVGERGTVDLVVRGEGGVTIGWSSVDGAGRKAAGLLEGIGLDDPAALTDGPDKSYLVPLPLSFDVAGKKTYTLTTLSSPHVPTLALEGQAVSFVVLPVPSVSFAPGMACSATRPLVLANPALVKSRRPDHLTVLSAEQPLEGHPFRANVSFTPAENGQQRTVGMTLRQGSNALRVDESGEGLWRIESVGVDGAGGRCGGDVKEPRECRVVYAPAPRLVRYDVRKLEDDCAGEQGVTVSFVLLGQAPLKLAYSLTTTPFPTAKNPHPQPSRTVTRVETLTSNTGEVTLRPEVEGDYVYSLVSLSDARYVDGVPVEGEVRGSVRPVATADFGLRGVPLVRGQDERQLRLWECESKQVELDVTVGGTPPFALEFLTSTAAESTVETVTFASAGRHRLSMPVPSQLAAQGGNYTVGLSGVRDGNGCSRKLTKQPVKVEVRVGRPTAKIAGAAADRVAVVTEGTAVNAPLRLTGEGPWTVKYQSSKLAAPIEEKQISAPNTDFTFKDAAVYKLLSVKDAHCEGSIVPGQDTFEIRHLPRPSVSLQVDETAIVKRKSWRPKSVCVGAEDHVALNFEGQAPFEVGYSVSRSGKVLHRDQHKNVLRAIGSSTTFALDTDEPGRYTYTFDRVGDRNYGLAPIKGGKITFDHEVYGRPSAMWLSTETVSLCANSRLTPATLGPRQGVLALKGKAPFSVTLHVMTPKSSHPVVRTVDNIKVDEWPVAIHDFEFTQLGMYTVAVESVRDASGCAQDLTADGAEDAKVFRVEVAETASVVQVQKGEDVCVGQSLDFLLQGSPPWTLTTTFDGAERQITQRDGKFSRLADKPGTFALTSIAHQRNQCRTPVTDVVRRVHALPSARVKAGEHFVETVEEGEQAEIVFEFEGEAPFTFTYTWSTPGRSPKVLETHTVSGIMENSYSIFASAEGVWKVVEIEDRWCRFPPLAAARSGTKPASLLEGVEVFPPLTAP